jgi:hypothetical protein
MRRRERPGRRRLIVSSAALVLVSAVGLAAVYGSIVPGQPDRQSLPAAALAVSERPDAADATDSSTGPTTVPDATAEPTPEPATPRAATPEPTNGESTKAESTTPEPTKAESTTPEPTKAELTPEPATPRVATPEPATPEPRIVASSTRPGVATTADQNSPAGNRTDRPRAADVTARGGSSVTQNGWVCDGSVTLEDPRGRRWSLGRAAFRAGPGYERVVLHIDRLGPGSGAPASMTAQALPTSKVRGTIPGVRTPSSGQTTFSLHLAGPIEGNLGVRSYRPNGLRMLKEFSVYPAAGGSSRVLVSAASGECYRVRVPAWTATGPNTRTAQIYLDIKS